MCNTTTNAGILALGLFLLIAFDAFTTTTAIWPFDKTTVQVRNLVRSKDGRPAHLTVHCKDKNHDVGVKELVFNQSFSFDFKPTFWGFSQYYCGFTWNNVLHWFDIYIQNRDEETCHKFCDWIVNATGPCLHNPGSDVYNQCYGWNKQALPLIA